MKNIFGKNRQENRIGHPHQAHQSQKQEQRSNGQKTEGIFEAGLEHTENIRITAGIGEMLNFSKDNRSPATAIVTPAREGPSRRAQLNKAELRAMALPKSSLFPIKSTTKD